MDLNNILSISGRPGLFQLKAQTSQGIIANSLVDGKRVVTSANQQIRMLSDIQVYCIGKETPLIEVFKKMLVHEKGRITSLKPKATVIDLEAYFFEIIDNYDEDRVYPSDIKKIIQWYNLLVQKKKIKLAKSRTDIEPNQMENESSFKEFEK